MGLDGVELVMGVEDRFGIKLSDAECDGVRTVRELASLVVAKLPLQAGACATARSFFELRRMLMAELRVERGSVRPRTRLAELFPAGLNASWDRLCEQERRLPRLWLSDGGIRVLAWLGASLTVAWIVSLALLCRGSSSWLGAVLGGVCTACIALAMFARCAARMPRRFPDGIETVGDVARRIAPIEIAGDSDLARRKTEARVLEEVRRLTAEQLGLSIDRVQPDSEFVKDLGMD